MSVKKVPLQILHGNVLETLEGFGLYLFITYIIYDYTYIFISIPILINIWSEVFSKTVLVQTN